MPRKLVLTEMQYAFRKLFGSEWRESLPRVLVHLIAKSYDQSRGVVLSSFNRMFALAMHGDHANLDAM